MDNAVVPDQVSEDDLILSKSKILSDNEYCGIVYTLNSVQRNFLLHMLHFFKEDKLLLYHSIFGRAAVGKSRLITALLQIKF